MPYIFAENVGDQNATAGASSVPVSAGGKNRRPNVEKGICTLFIILPFICTRDHSPKFHVLLFLQYEHLIN
jgi:hypothetical protein